MSVHIRQAKVIDPQSRFHDQLVDISFDPSSPKGTAISITAAKAGKPAILVDDKVQWEGNEDNLYISPGFIDIFADYREPGYEHKETIESGLRAAAAGGFTDVFLVPNTNPSLSTKSTVQYILQKANGGPVKIHPLGSITQDIEGKSLAEMLDMHANGAIAFSDGWKPVQNANLMLKALEYARSFDGVLVQLPVDDSLSSGGLMHEGIMSTRLGMAGIPILAESIMIHRDIELLRYTGSKLHITGVSTAEGVSLIRKAKSEGLQVTCSVTPYHLALTDESLSGYDSAFKVTPVLRSEADRQALIAGLKDGTIDCITSHHRPQEWDAKAKEFEYASDGMSVQELAFSIVYSAIGREVLLDRIIEAFTFQPANIFGLGHRSVEDSGPAFTVFTTSGSWTLQKEEVQSSSANNPFVGRELQGKVLGIISQNQIRLNR
jgi:dihydroorotase